MNNAAMKVFFEPEGSFVTLQSAQFLEVLPLVEDTDLDDIQLLFSSEGNELLLSIYPGINRYKVLFNDEEVH